MSQCPLRGRGFLRVLRHRFSGDFRMGLRSQTSTDRLKQQMQVGESDFLENQGLHGGHATFDGGKFWSISGL